MKNVLNAIYLFIFLVLEGGQGCSFVAGLLVGAILLIYWPTLAKLNLVLYNHLELYY